MNYGKRKIKADGIFVDWNNVSVTYKDTRGDVTHRDADGYAGLHYVNSTGRNDIHDAKVAITTNGKVAFYVKTDKEITPYTANENDNWMLLLIDADKNNATGWYGYDYIINKKVVSSNITTLMKYDDGVWSEVAKIPYAVNGNEMELEIPLSLLSMKGKNISFDFKWADNPGELTDPIAFCLYGDSAPNRRFNYRFIWQNKMK